MANTKSTVEVVFGVVDDTFSGISSVTSNIDGLVSGLESASQPLANMADNIIKADIALGLLAISIAAISFKNFIEAENATLDLQKVLEGTKEETKVMAASMSADMDKLALAFGANGAELTQSLANFTQSGFDASEAAGLVKTSLKAMIAGDIDATAATDILIRSLKGFNAPASDAERILEILNNTSNKYATSLPKLAEGFAGIAPVAKLMNLSYEETVGFLTPVIEAFQSGSEAAIALKTGFLRIQKDSDKVNDALELVGITSGKMGGKLLTAKEKIYAVAAGFGDLNEAQKIQVSQSIFGIEQTARLSTAFNNFGKVQEITANAMRDTNTVGLEVETRLNSLDNVVNKTKDSFRQMTVALAGQGNESVTELLKSISSAFLSLSNILKSDSNLDPIFESFNTVVLSASKNISRFAELLPDALNGVDTTQLGKAIEDTFDALSDLFGFDLSDAESLGSGIQSVVDTVTSLTQVTEGMIRTFDKFLEGTIKPLLEKYNTMDEATQKSFGSLLAGGKIVNVVSGFVGDFTGSLNVLSGLLAGNLLVNIVGMSSKLAPLGATALTAGKALGVLTPQLIALSAAFVGGFGFGKLINDLTGASDHFSDFALFLRNFGDLPVEVATKLQYIQETLKDTSITTENMNEKWSDYLLTLKATKGETDNASTGIYSMNDAIRRHNGTLKDQRDLNQEYIASLGDIQVGFGSTAQVAEYYNKKLMEGTLTQADRLVMMKQFVALQDAEKSAIAVAAYEQENMNRHLSDAHIRQLELKEVTGELVDVTDDYAFTLQKTGVNFGLVTEEMKQAKEETDKFRISMEEIASDERIANLELTVGLNVAELESNTQIAVASIEGLASSVISTNDLIASLFSQEAPEWDRFGFETSRSINAANDRASALNDAQVQLVESQAEYYTAKVQSLGRGDAQLTIEAAGLEPELEAFMFKILKKIQVKMASEQSAFLLGG